MSSPVSGSQPGCEARESTLHKAMPHRPCFDHQPQDSAFQQKPWSFASQHATQAIHAMQPMYINHTEWNPMSDTHPFTSSFWVWTKPEAPYSSSHMSNTGERSSHIRSISKYVWTITTYYLVLGVQPNQDISNHPNDVKTSGLQPPSSSSTYRRISYSEWV